MKSLHGLDISFKTVSAEWNNNRLVHPVPSADNHQSPFDQEMKELKGSSVYRPF